MFYVSKMLMKITDAEVSCDLLRMEGRFTSVMFTLIQNYLRKPEKTKYFGVSGLSLFSPFYSYCCMKLKSISFLP